MNKKEMLKQLEAKASELLAKYLESLSEDDKKKLDDLMDSIDKLKAEIKADEEKEALEKKEKEALDEKQKHQNVPEDLRDVGKKISEENEKFVKNLREAVQMGTKFTGAMPTEMSTTIQSKLETLSDVYSRCTIHRNLTGNYTVLVEGDEATVGYTGEGATIGETSPSINPLPLGALKLGGLAKVSNEMIDDMGVDIIGWLTDVFAKAFARAIEHEILLGAGTSSKKDSIRGIITNATNVITAASAESITWEEVKETVQALTNGRSGATIILSQRIADMIYSFKDGSKYMFDQTRAIDKILGCDVLVSSQMPEFASGKAVMVVGNFSYYHIAIRKDVETTVLHERYADSDQTGVKATCRIDGDFVKNQFAVLKLGA